MSEVTASQPITITAYSINLLQMEVHDLVQKGLISRQQPLYTLCRFIPPREWPWVEWELERHGYLLRDRIIDLFPREIWLED